MNEKKYCIDCRYYLPNDFSHSLTGLTGLELHRLRRLIDPEKGTELCMKTEKEIPVETYLKKEIKYDYELCKDKNANNDCEDFKSIPIMSTDKDTKIYIPQEKKKSIIDRILRR